MGITHENLLSVIEKSRRPVKLIALAEHFNTSYQEVYDNVSILEQWELVKITENVKNSLTTVQPVLPQSARG